MNHRPLNSLLLFSRLMAEHFASTPYGKLYAGPEHATAGQTGDSRVSE